MVVLAGMVYGQSSPARILAGTALKPTDLSSDVLTPKESLVATYSDSRGPATASCTGVDCLSTPTALFAPVLVCPAQAGKSCTYDIQVTGQVKTTGITNSDGQDGVYQFLVDGVLPSGGGTDDSGFFAWQIGGPSFTYGTSYNVHSKVKNTTLNQSHNVLVNFACQDIDGGGCTASLGFQTIVVRVWTP
jgi:hypothetical protein